MVDKQVTWQEEGGYPKEKEAQSVRETVFRFWPASKRKRESRIF